MINKKILVPANAKINLFLTRHRADFTKSRVIQTRLGHAQRQYQYKKEWDRIIRHREECEHGTLAKAPRCLRERGKSLFRR